MHGQEDNLDVGIMLLEQAQRIDAIELGHRDVGHDNVRTQFFGRRQQRVAVFDGTHQFEIFGEKALQAFSHHTMVISQ